MSEAITKKTAKGIVYKAIEKIGTQLVSLVISILLARLLSPDDYGEIALVMVVIAFLDVFINNGLSTAVVHKKNAEEIDFSTCFWSSLGISFFFYGLLFFTAPLIATYFETPKLTVLLRVMGIQLFLLSIQSVQVAVISRTFRYRLLMLATVVSTFLSGIIGCVCAFSGFGVWALVVQSLALQFLLTLLLFIMLKWKPRFQFSFKRLSDQIRYSWKLLLVGIVDCIYVECRSLIIAKKYSSRDLSFYNKGAQFPKLVSDTLNQTIGSVLFPSMSMLQDQKDEVKELTRKSISFLTFVLFPMLFGLFSVGDSLIELLLTEKWLPCVPYLKILCIAYIFAPIQSVHKQTYKALNQNQTYFILNIVEKAVGICLLILFYPYGVFAIAVSFVAYHVVGLLLYAFFTRKILGYSVLQQLWDVLENLIPSVIMMVAVFALGEIFNTSLLFELIVQIVIGIATYFLICFCLKNRSLNYLFGFFRQRKKN